ncbi:MAG: hypothetical protein ACREDR_05435, partial [Blastocatellia bacterium]
ADTLHNECVTRCCTDESAAYYPDFHSGVLSRSILDSLKPTISGLSHRQKRIGREVAGEYLSRGSDPLA